jgi:hypothetical protein
MMIWGSWEDGDVLTGKAGDGEQAQRKKARRRRKKKCTHGKENYSLFYGLLQLLERRHPRKLVNKICQAESLLARKARTAGPTGSSPAAPPGTSAYAP